MKKLLLLLLFIPLVSFGQTNYGIELCYRLENRGFMSSSKADEALNKILSVIGASKRFVLSPCNRIPNALATNYKGIRYILYNEKFMQDVTNYTNNWSNLAILAHEVGHHINGHTLISSSLAESRKMELEADEFAGFILAKLGASLAETLSFTKIFPEKDDTYEYHPTRSKRINAVKTGFNKAGGGNLPERYKTNESTISVEQYFNRASDEFYSKDYYGAITTLTKIIELAPDHPLAYYKRGIIKEMLKDPYGAIADLTTAIRILPTEPSSYYIRANTKKDLMEDYYGAISDYSAAIRLNPSFIDAYLSRGVCKDKLKDYYGAISDYTQAIDLEPNDHRLYGNRGISKDKLEDYYGAINDYNQAIRLCNDKNDKAGYYMVRGLAKFSIKDKNGACQDYIQGQRLGYKVPSEMFSICN